MILLSHRLVLAETAQLLRLSEGDGLKVDDLSFDGDMLTCKDIPGGLALTDSTMQLSVNEFSAKLLTPWLARMTRLKALRCDLVALGVVHD